MNHLKAGFLFTGVAKFSNLIIYLLVNAILSRLLTPEEYGVVSIVQVFILFFQLFVEAGMGPAIIQNKKLTDRDHSVLFNFSLIIAITLAILYGLFGYVLSNIYSNRIYISLSWLQTISILFNGLNVVPTAILNKKKKFKEVNFNFIIANMFSGLGGVLSAVAGLGVYSLIISSIILTFLSFILNFRKSNTKLVKEWDSSVLQDILGFSMNQFSFNFINYFSRNADNILIGRYIGPAALGNYSKAYQLLMMPNNILLGIINPVLQPVLSDYQNDVSLIRETYFKILRLLALVGVSLSVFLSVFSKEIILFLFGNQWGLAVFPFRVLATTVWVQMTLSSTGAIFQARNKTRDLLTTGIYSAIILVTSIVVGIVIGDLNSVAISLTVGFYINYFMNFSRVMKLALDSNIVVMLKEFKNPFIIGLIELVVLRLLYPLVIGINNVFLILLISGLIFAVVFLIASYFLGEIDLLKSSLGD